MARYSAALLALAACTPAAREVMPASAYSPTPSDGKEPALRAVPEEQPKGPLKSEPSQELTASESAPAPVERKLAALGPFYDALDALRAGQRKTSVRIFWLGDSHTAADFMTHSVREHLVELGGDGGPGFVRLGLEGYRHGAVHLSVYGRWRKAPILPAQRTRVLDGVFGYGGIRTLPTASSGASARVREPRGKPVVWTISHRLLGTSQLGVRLGEQKLRLGPDDGGAERGATQWTELVADDSEELSVHHIAGDPQIFGAFAEYKEPGVVLDTVGIDGARTATALAWEPEQFATHVERRAPDLLVLAFGTNEVFDQTDPQRYVEHNRKLVELVRQARPGIPCWIVGPPDSATSEGNSKARVSLVTEVQRSVADEVGCAFTSAYEIMGGEGGFTRWARERPARARSDRIHLTISGYRSLGDLLAKALVEGKPLAKPGEDDSGSPSTTDALSAP